MSFERFIALRYLLSRPRESFISVIALISVAGVALGVASLIIVIGVMSGFSANLRDRLLGINSHIIVTDLTGAMSAWEDVAGRAASVDGVVGATPFIYSEVIISTPRGVKGVVLRGIDPETAPSAIDLPSIMTNGTLEALETDSPIPGIIVGKQLAQRLGAYPGSRVNVLSPTGKRTAAGFAPKVKFFRVVGVFSTGMFEYDTSLAFTTLPAAAELTSLPEDLVTGIELRTDDIYNTGAIGDAVEEVLKEPTYSVRDWIDMNGNLFAALKLEKTGMFIVLAMIVLVGTFSIVTTLVMLVMEKTRDIALLMAMGATRRQIRRIFMIQGMIIGVAGTALGYALGIGTSLLLRKYQFIKLPKDVYALDHLPVLLQWSDLSIIGVVAVFMCFFSTVYPARRAARLRPADELR